MMVILREMARTDEIIPPLMKNMHPKDLTNAQAFFYDINKITYMVARELGCISDWVWRLGLEIWAMAKISRPSLKNGPALLLPYM